MNSVIIGNNIRIIREMKGFTQEYVATLLNMSQNNYSKIENGKNKINIDFLSQLGTVLEVEPIAFLESPDSFIQHNNNQSGGNAKIVKNIINNISEEFYEQQIKNMQSIFQNQLHEIRTIYENQIKILNELLKHK